MSSQIEDQIATHVQLCTQLRDEIGRLLVGQEKMVTSLLTGLLTGGHILLEGLPGLAKTLAVQSLSEAIHTDFSRIQFTPDMLPADVIGTQIFNPKEATFSIKKGPVWVLFNIYKSNDYICKALSSVAANAASFTASA